jgi:hypothetical protein
MKIMDLITYYIVRLLFVAPIIMLYYVILSIILIAPFIIFLLLPAMGKMICLTALFLYSIFVSFSN